VLDGRGAHPGVIGKRGVIDELPDPSGQALFFGDAILAVGEPHWAGASIRYSV
jgi:hypothetical protein